MHQIWNFFPSIILKCNFISIFLTNKKEKIKQYSLIIYHEFAEKRFNTIRNLRIYDTFNINLGTYSIRRSKYLCFLSEKLHIIFINYRRRLLFYLLSFCPWIFFLKSCYFANMNVSINYNRAAHTYWSCTLF